MATSYLFKKEYNIIIKCDSDEDKEEVLNIINEGLAPLDVQTLYQRKIVRYVE